VNPTPHNTKLGTDMTFQVTPRNDCGEWQMARQVATGTQVLDHPRWPFGPRHRRGRAFQTRDDCPCYATAGGICPAKMATSTCPR
jgi:hypothetical protein